MEIKNKKEINLTKQDVINIINKYIIDMGLADSGDPYNMNFIIKNEIRPGPYPQDGYDNYVFIGVKVEVTND